MLQIATVTTRIFGSLMPTLLMSMMRNVLNRGTSIRTNTDNYVFKKYVKLGRSAKNCPYFYLGLAIYYISDSQKVVILYKYALQFIMYLMYKNYCTIVRMMKFVIQQKLTFVLEVTATE